MQRSWCVHNVKAQFSLCDLPRLSAAELLAQRESRRNFVVRRHERFRYLVFPTSRRVGVTGVGDFDDVPRAVEVFCAAHRVTARPGSVRVHNSTASGRVERVTRCVLARFAAAAGGGGQDYTLSARTRSFPCILLRPRRAWRPRARAPVQPTPPQPPPRRATALLFTTGKCTVVGARSRHEIWLTVQHLLDLLHQYGGLPAPARGD